MENNTRKYLAEFFGTLLLVAVGTGAVVLVGVQTGPLPVALAFGIALAAGAYAFGPISGGHFNPAVSLGAAINGRISWKDFVGYVIAQLIGGLAGSAIVWAIMKGVGASATMIKQVGFGQTDYTTPVSFFGATVIELILTFFFVLVILMVTSKKAEGASVAAPMIIGLTLAALITVGISVTGASLNPARSLGPAVFFAMFGSATSLTHVAAYFIGPLVGGALAALVAKYGLGSEE